MKRRQEDVHVPFRILIPAGHSTFSVPVSKMDQKKHFFFTDLSLVPDMYSLQAADFGMDTDEELKKIINYGIYLSAHLTKDLYPGTYDIPTNIATTFDLMLDVNKAFERMRTDTADHLPFFIDWYDTRYMDSAAPTWDAFVRD